MIKNKVLTPVLSGVLAVSVVGSGVGYYFVNKGEPEKTMDTMKMSMTQVEQTMNDTVDDVQKAVNGKLDFAYDADLKISFGSSNSANTNNSGLNLQAKPIEISTKVRQKGQNTQSEIAAKYNNVTVATLETIYARDSKTGYVRIPELSSSYIKATEADIQKLVDDTTKKYTSKYQQRLDANKPQTKANDKQIIAPETKKKLDIDNIKEMLPDFSSIDSKKLEEKLKKWVEIVKGKISEKTDGGNVTGDIDGNKYDYKVKSYSINGKQAQEAVYAVLDDIAADKDIKKVFDDFYAKQSESTKKASNIKSFAELIADMKKSFTVSAADQNKVAALDVYYDGDEPTGAAINYDGKTLAKVVIINKSDVNAIDASAADNSGKNTFSVKGSAKLSDGKMNGKYTFDAKTSDNKKANITLTLDKVVIKDKTFSGTVTVDYSLPKTSVKQSTGSLRISGTANEDKKDLKIDITANGLAILNAEFKMNKTKATDVAIPTTDIFTIDKLEDYYKTCDIESFKANINAALGFNVFGIADSFGGLGRQGNGNITKKSTTGQNSTDIITGGLNLEDFTFA